MKLYYSIQKQMYRHPPILLHLEKSNFKKKDYLKKMETHFEPFACLDHIIMIKDCMHSVSSQQRNLHRLHHQITLKLNVRNLWLNLRNRITAQIPIYTTI